MDENLGDRSKRKGKLASVQSKRRKLDDGNEEVKGRREGEIYASKEQKTNAIKIQKLSQRKLNRFGRAGESDRHPGM